MMYSKLQEFTTVKYFSSIATHTFYHLTSNLQAPASGNSGEEVHNKHLHYTCNIMTAVSYIASKI